MSSTQSFKCFNCGETVLYEAIGTKNRNHCPFCLYSKHLDQDIPGDRRSDCFGIMKPIALAFKDYKIDPFSKKQTGQLMIVHLCQSCGKISANRIAGDDSEDEIVKLFNSSLDLKPEISYKLDELRIKLLTINDREELFRQLYGDNSVTFP